jgi:hypothetical protein
VGFPSTTAPSNPETQSPHVSIGYTCICGERVVVYRLRSRRENALPLSKTVTCVNGHVATFFAEQFAFLDDWEDE